MGQASFLHPDRLFSSDARERAIARDLYEEVSELPIVSPHGHTDPKWFSKNEPFSDAAELFLTPDHYVLRMLASRGLSYDDLGVPRKDGKAVADSRAAWRLFAAHYHCFLGTPSRMWIDHSLHWAFGIEEPLSNENADRLFDLINERLKDEDLLPVSVLDRARVEAIATTEFALDYLEHHRSLARRDMIGRIRTTYRPDDVTDPDNPAFTENLSRLAEMTGQDTAKWEGMIQAHRIRRAFFRKYGATATDHGVPTCRTANLPAQEKQRLLTRILREGANPDDAELFRAQMLTEMAGLSVEDGMVMQIHAGSRRNTDLALMAARGANLGADIPSAIDAVRGLEPLLNIYGSETKFRLIFFCLDETAYSRELAPMAGYWPALILGPPWWFHDSPRGIARYLDTCVESAGFYNLAGFNDDTRALLSIPARHDVWRRCAASFLAAMVAGETLGKGEARQLAEWLSYGAAVNAYRLS
jgi:glucuronate isomerase